MLALAPPGTPAPASLRAERGTQIAESLAYCMSHLCLLNPLQVCIALYCSVLLGAACRAWCCMCHFTWFNAICAASSAVCAVRTGGKSAALALVSFLLPCASYGLGVLPMCKHACRLMHCV